MQASGQTVQSGDFCSKPCVSANSHAYPRGSRDLGIAPAHEISSGCEGILPGPHEMPTFLSQYLTQKAVGQFDLGPAAAFSLIYFLIILLLCFILYNWMQRVGTADKTGGAHG